jgi:hypothetical protein
MAEKNMTQAQCLVAEAEENAKRAEHALKKFKMFIVEEGDRSWKTVSGERVKKLSADGLNAALRALRSKLFNYEKKHRKRKRKVGKSKNSGRKGNGYTRK